MYKDLEQNHFSFTAKTIHRIGHDCIRLGKCMAFYDNQYENFYYFDFLASVLYCLKEVF